jgi:hypothetical protein
MKLIPISLVAVSLLSACASLTTGPNQSVSVETGPVAGATCELQNDKGKWFVNSTPGSVIVNRAYSDLNVTCKKDNWYGNNSFKSNTKGMAYANILAGGVIGGAIDVGTGSAYDYPPALQIQMQKTK